MSGQEAFSRNGRLKLQKNLSDKQYSSLNVFYSATVNKYRDFKKYTSIEHHFSSWGMDQLFQQHLFPASGTNQSPMKLTGIRECRL